MKLIINPATGLLEPSPSVTGYLTKSQADTYYYPISTNPAGYVKGFNTLINLIDWVLNGSNYELSITHNLNSSYLITEIKESNNTIFVNELETIDTNNIKLKVPAIPDLRFAGSIAINAT